MPKTESWLRKLFYFKERRMVREKPIYCPNPKCGKKVTTQEALMYYVIPDGGYKCPHCGEVVIRNTKITY
jgi:predicted RNA-binding Zn-ribbon protein involved in translation (DUF1610 family)